VRNNYLPVIKVDPETFSVTVDGEPATVAAAKSISLNRLYFFS
jgi:urease subunit alpha